MLNALYRPVGLFELQLLQANDYHAFPPRLSHQPIFYPVLNLEYATQIAREWNTKDAQSGYMGAVTVFQLPQTFLERYEVHTVGTSLHQELWVPAEELEMFNEQIVGRIRVVAAYYGVQFGGEHEW